MSSQVLTLISGAFFALLSAVTGVAIWGIRSKVRQMETDIVTNNKENAELSTKLTEHILGEEGVFDERFEKREKSIELLITNIFNDKMKEIRKGVSDEVSIGIQRGVGHFIDNIKSANSLGQYINNRAESNDK